MMTLRMRVCLAVLALFLTLGICLPVDAATVGYWRFEDAGPDASSTGGTAGTMTAFGSPARSATVPVNPVPKTGAANTQSSALDGSDDMFATNGGVLFADRFSDASDVGAGNFTLEGWIDLSSVTADGNIFGKSTAFGSSSQDYGYWITVQSRASGTKFGLRAFTRTSGNPTKDALADNLDFNVPHHFALVRNGDEMTIYHDGVPQQTRTGLGAGTDFRSRVPYTIGGSLTGTGPVSAAGFTGAGLIDEFRISNVALSPGQFLNGVPEPGSILLFGIGVVGLLGFARRRK